MFRFLFGPRRERRAPDPLPPSDESFEEFRLQVALEIERRLYESAFTALEQVFAKEGLVAAFLTSGAIVAFASSLGAFAQLAPQLDAATIRVVGALFVVSLGLLVVATFRFAALLKGREVRELTGAVPFLNEGSPTDTRAATLLKLIAEYQATRKSFEETVSRRYRNMRRAMTWLGAATLASFAAILLAFGMLASRKSSVRPSSVPERLAQQKTTYDRKEMSNTSGTQKPAPIVLPQPGPGTPVIRGGGGDAKKR